MGKLKSEVVVDESVRESLLNDSEPSIGLIIGTVAENSDFHVAHFAATLEDEERGDGDAAANDNSVEQIGERKKTNFDTVQPSMLAFHAKQVLPMIPGGLSILGIYTVDPKDTVFTFATEPQVKSMVASVVKGIQKTFSWYNTDFEDQKEMLFIHYNPKNKKYAGKIFDLGTQKSRATDVVTRPLSWCKLECEFDTVAVMHVPKKDTGAPLKKNLQSLMKSFQESLNSARFLINGRFPSTEEVYKEIAHTSELDNSLEDLDCDELDDERKVTDNGHASPSAVHILFEKEPGILRCETPVDTSDPSNGPRSACEDEFINHLHVQGKISVIAFAPEGSSTVCMANRLRTDIVRSMSSRIVMHCESLIDEESTTEPLHNVLVHHEIPRRVFVEIPNTNLLVSDYLFPGDGPNDCILSFRDILSIHVDDEGSVMIDKEQPFSNDMQIRGSVEELLSQADGDMKFAVEGVGARKIVAGMLLFIALFFVVSFIVPHFLRISTNSDGNSKKEL